MSPARTAVCIVCLLLGAVGFGSYMAIRAEQELAAHAPGVVHGGSEAVVDSMALCMSALDIFTMVKKSLDEDPSGFSRKRVESIKVLDMGSEILVAGACGKIMPPRVAGSPDLARRYSDAVHYWMTKELLSKKGLPISEAPFSYPFLFALSLSV